MNVYEYNNISQSTLSNKVIKLSFEYTLQKFIKCFLAVQILKIHICFIFTVIRLERITPQECIIQFFYLLTCCFITLR